MAGTETKTVIDSLTSQLGSFGKYQLFIFMLIVVPVCFNAVSTLGYVFTTSGIEQRCKVPECDTSASEYWEHWVDFSIPYENGVPSKCTRFRPAEGSADWDTEKCSAEMFGNGTLACTEFIYKNTETSIANEWDLACPENAWKLTLIGTINNVGQFVGMPLGAFVSDRYGRRIALAAGGSFSAVMGLLKSFSTNYEMFALLEFLDASMACVIYTTAWIIGIELVAQKRRAVACCALSIFYAIGEISLGIIAKYVQNWRTIIRVLYVPALIHLIYFCVLPESIRWLISQRRTDNVISQMRRIAQVNKKVLPEESLMNLRNILTSDSEEKTEQEYPFTTAFKSPRLLWRTLTCSFCWFANTLVYYGLSLNAVTLAGDKYLNFILTCVIEIPAFLIASFLMDKIGRRISLCGSLLLSGATCGFAILVQNNNDHIWALLLYLTGKFAITASFTTLYVYTAEIFPTNIRQSLLSVCSMIGRIGSMLAPQTILLGQSLTYLPLLLFSGCATISGLLALQFPETNSKELPDTIQEAEKVEKSESS